MTDRRNAKQRRISIALVAISLLPIWTTPEAKEKQKMEITVQVDFGEDRGQNLGTLFEARNRKGEVVFGAGFAGLYNTRFRMDRLTLQFFVRGDDEPTCEKLPAPSEDGGNYLFDFDGQVYQFSDYQHHVIRWWDDPKKAWHVDETFGQGATRSGEGKMRVAGKVLQFLRGEVWYDGNKILSQPEVGHYHHFYYALGHFVFFHNNRDGNPPFSRLFAVPWVPGSDLVDLSKAVTLEVKYPGETSFAIGQLGKEIIYSSNKGGVYVFDGKTWRVLRESNDKVSYQIYSMLNWYDRLLMGHYPTGNLLVYDGKEIRHLKDSPPVMPGVSTYSREAQTTCIYGGDLYVGVWPWAELWRYDAHTEKWNFVRRMFQKPAITDKVGHPWEDEIKEFNKSHNADIVFNNWGQRVSGLTPMGEWLYIAVSAKGCFPRDARLDFLRDDAVWNEYRIIHRMRKPGCLSAPIQWTGKPTNLQFTVTNTRLTITQDGRKLGSASMTPALAAKTSNARLEWGKGMFGPLQGRIVTKNIVR